MESVRTFLSMSFRQSIPCAIALRHALLTPVLAQRDLASNKDKTYSANPAKDLHYRIEI